MSQAKALFEQGQLGQAIEELTREIKNSPSDIGLRTFLFELLCFAGEWDRAEQQLDVIGHQNAKAELAIQVYRNNIKAERDRRSLFTDGIAPHFLIEPPAYIDHLLSAIKSVQIGTEDETQRLIDQAEQERPFISGRVNDLEFQDFRDCNELTGPVLELILHDKYTWLPFQHLKRIEIDTPGNLRDLLWTSARIEAADGTTAQAFVPALYPGSAEHPNDQVRLGRITEWKDVQAGLNVPVGSRLFVIDDDEKQIFETSVIEFNTSVSTTNREDEVVIANA